MGVGFDVLRENNIQCRNEKDEINEILSNHSVNHSDRSFIGYLINVPGHYVSIRIIDDKIVYFDSLVGIVKYSFSSIGRLKNKISNARHIVSVWRLEE